jgi:hypothetical protein
VISPVHGRDNSDTEDAAIDDTPVPIQVQYPTPDVEEEENSEDENSKADKSM